MDVVLDSWGLRVLHLHEVDLNYLPLAILRFEVFEDKGLAGCHLEDQIAEKRCGHLDNKELVSKEKMVKKIQESVKARKDNNWHLSDQIREELLNKGILNHIQL